MLVKELYSHGSSNGESCQNCCKLSSISKLLSRLLNFCNENSEYIIYACTLWHGAFLYLEQGLHKIPTLGAFESPWPRDFNPVFFIFCQLLVKRIKLKSHVNFFIQLFFLQVFIFSNICLLVQSIFNIYKKLIRYLHETIVLLRVFFIRYTYMYI